MKKGCFLTAIAVATIVIGAALYIFQNHFDSLVLNPGKKLIAGFVKDELDQKLEPVVESAEKNKLKEIIQKYALDTETLKKLKDDDVKKIISTIESAIADSIIQKAELEEISQIIESKLK